MYIVEAIKNGKTKYLSGGGLNPNIETAIRFDDMSIAKLRIDELLQTNDFVSLIRIR